MSLIQKILVKSNALRLVSCRICDRNYATDKGTTVGVSPGIASLGKAGKKKIGVIKMEKKTVEPETDPHKLVNFVCGTNLLAEGGETVEIKPDSEYPDWLWNLYTGPAKTIDELDPNTLEYWEEVQRLGKEKEQQYRKWKLIF